MFLLKRTILILTSIYYHPINGITEIGCCQIIPKADEYIMNTKVTPTIDEVLSEWKKDAIIDESKLSNEIVRVPMLHSKYLEYFIFFKQRLSAVESKKNKMGWQKRKYFRGEMALDDLQKHGWSQWNGLKPSTTELNQLLEFDTDMNDLTRIVSELKTSVSGCEYIMNQLKGREYALKTLFEYMKYIGGN